MDASTVRPVTNLYGDLKLATGKADLLLSNSSSSTVASAITTSAEDSSVQDSSKLRFEIKNLAQF